MKMDAKLCWWRFLWIGVILSALALGFVNLFLWHTPLEKGGKRGEPHHYLNTDRVVYPY